MIPLGGAKVQPMHAIKPRRESNFMDCSNENHCLVSLLVISKTAWITVPNIFILQRKIQEILKCIISYGLFIDFSTRSLPLIASSWYIAWILNSPYLLIRSLYSFTLGFSSSLLILNFCGISSSYSQL